MRIGVIIGSTRSGRAGEAVGEWVYNVVTKRHDAEYELVDLIDFNLPLLTAAVPPAMADRNYGDEATRQWSQKIDSFDGFIFVTPEYNRGVPGAFKNAVDLLYPEWTNKTVTFVGYSSDGAIRAIESWRSITANLRMVHTRAQVGLSLFQDFGADGFNPSERREGELNAAVDELVTLTKKIRD